MSGFLCTMVGASFTVAAVAEVLRSKKAITAVGNAQIDTAQSKFGGASLLLDDSPEAYLTVAHQADLLTGTGAFTVEGWFRPQLAGDAGQGVGTRFWFFKGVNSATGFGLGVTTDGVRFRGPGQTDLVYTGSISSSAWTHIAFVWDGTNKKIYVNGTQQATAVASINVTDTTNYQIGYFTGIFAYNGWIDEIRVSNSLRYSTTFTPSTTPFVNDANTLLLIHADGTDASTFFEDDNGVRASRSLIAIGNAQIDTAQSKFGGSALLCDGTGDYVRSAAGTQWDFGTSSFSIEYFIRFNVAPTLYVPIALRSSASINNGEWWCEITNAEKKMYWGFKNQAGTQYYVNLALAGTAFTTGVWYHIALVNNAGTAQLYIDGVATGATTALAGSFGNNSTDLWVGAGAGAYSLNGWMEEVRISNTARYTANFTSPTQPFVNDANTLLLIHADGTDGSQVFRDDNGEVPVAITTTDAVSFDGSGDYYEATSLSNSAAADSKYALIALNLYWAGGNNLQHPFNIRLGTGSGDYGFWIWVNGGRSQLKFVTGTGSVPGSIYENTENSLTANAWNQIVIWVDTTSSTTSQIWVNGNSKAYSNDGFPTGALFNWTNTASTVKIGQKNTSQTGDGNDFNGRISQVYISAASSFPGIDKFWQQGKPLDLGTTGTATGLAQPLIYHYGGTSTFPTNRGSGFSSYTLTANGGVTTSANNSVYQVLRTQKGISAIGNAQIDTAQSKFGGASALFDGTGDKLEIPYSSDLALGTPSWTVEYWIRITTQTGQYTNTVGIWDDSTANGATYYFSCNMYDTSQRMGIQYYYSGNNSGPIQFGSTLTTGTWQHHAFVKNGNTLTAYKDGVSQGTHDMTGRTISPYNSTPTTLKIGGLVTAGYLNGYMDEIRISNTARYTANFTAPTAPFQNDANTVLLLHMDGTDGSTVFFDDNGIAPYTP